MMNPKVGLTVLISSFITLLTIVVLPALSKPLQYHGQLALITASSSTHSIRIRISLSFIRALRRIESILLLESLPQSLLGENTT